MKDLKKEVLEAQTKGDIAELYMLEQRAQDELSEDELMGYYANILDLALERLTDVLEAKIRMDMGDVRDFATLRALYEYAMEHYSAGSLHDASALFEILGGLSNNETFSNAMEAHRIFADLEISMDQFINKMADIKQVESTGSFYINAFTKEAQKLLDNAKTATEK
jgi:hypothetical protein